MKSNTAALMMSAAGEIFSHDATSANDEKINTTPANAPVLACIKEDDVTLISKPNHTCHTVEKVQDGGFVHDLQHLTGMQLRRKYAAEANSHRNMLSRSDKVHPAFREFRNFLQIVGPMPVSGATLDRIDNSDPEYAPGKVRWADKRTQNNNKGDTLTFHNQHTGEVLTASRLAKLQGVSPSTIRKRVERGWSDAEIIAGARLASPPFMVEECPPPAPPRAFDRRRETETCVPMQSRPIQDIQFERMASYFAHCREHDGEEALPAPPYAFNEDLPEAWHITDEQWMVRFKKDWPQYRPHLIFERAEPYHQRAIELIDPEYVKRERAKIAQREVLKAQL